MEDKMDYRSEIMFLLDKIKDEKILRRVWKILDRAYDKGQ